MTLKVKVNDPRIQYQSRESQDPYLLILGQIHHKLLRGQAKFPRTLESKWPKWHWRSRSTSPIFNISGEYRMMRVWCKVGDSSPKLWRVITPTSRISKMTVNYTFEIIVTSPRRYWVNEITQQDYTRATLILKLGQNGDNTQAIGIIGLQKYLKFKFIIELWK